jgi:UDP-N-acetylmuramyl pentapeptide phosphotransferase/UDP-N-acetylglucosamine-1-phosphate transferase
MYAVRKVLFITTRNKIYDTPDESRKIKGAQIPSLGGIGIFTGFMVVSAFYMYDSIANWRYVIASIVILFFTGIYDDLANMRPSKKLLAQLVASAITIYFADIQSTTLLQLIGIDLPQWLFMGLLTLGCAFFINAFNFIDGIDGLACVLAILYTSALGVLFIGLQASGAAYICFSLAGATGGLLYYNHAPAKIYMCDTGSMLLGFMIFVLSVLLLKVYGSAASHTIHPIISTFSGAGIMVIALLTFPVFDALRVFVYRAANGKSPLVADRSHMHYYLIDAGFSHTQSVAIIASVNLLLIGMAYCIKDWPLAWAVIVLNMVSALSMAVVYAIRQKRRQV